MKKLLLTMLMLVLILQACKVTTISESHIYEQKNNRGNKNWKLVWEDNFNGATLDTSKWTKVPPGNSDWNKHMTSNEICYASGNGLLHLRGINNPDTSIDKRPFLTGGIYSKGKFAFRYGKIEIRAKLGCANGAWPAMWMLAEKNKYGEYPRNGEIDIQEHLNFDSIVYQTIHSYYTLNLKQDKNPAHYGTAKININDFNVFGIKWYPDKIVYILNGEETFTYPRENNVDATQWPFDQPFYILIDQQLGGSWVGNVKPEELPVEMVIDWVKVYQ